MVDDKMRAASTLHTKSILRLDALLPLEFDRLSSCDAILLLTGVVLCAPIWNKLCSIRVLSFEY